MCNSEPNGQTLVKGQVAVCFSVPPCPSPHAASSVPCSTRPTLECWWEPACRVIGGAAKELSIIASFLFFSGIFISLKSPWQLRKFHFPLSLLYTFLGICPGTNTWVCYLVPHGAQLGEREKSRREGKEASGH